MDKDIKKSISATDKDAQYDEKAKNLLGHKIILAHILVKTIDEFKGMKRDAPFILDNGTYAIPSGTLYVTEVKAPSGYGIDKKTHEFLMPAQNDENGYYSIKELTATPIKVVEPPLGKIWCAQVKLKKVDENGKGLKGAKFYIWDNEKCTGDPIGQLESGVN